MLIRQTIILLTTISCVCIDVTKMLYRNNYQQAGFLLLFTVPVLSVHNGVKDIVVEDCLHPR